EKSDLVPVMSSGLLEHLQINLVDLLSYIEHNNRYSYILTLIDVFSHYIWAILIKDKEGNIIHGELTLHETHKKSPYEVFFGFKIYAIYNMPNTLESNTLGTISPEHILPVTILLETISPGTISPETIPLGTLEHISPENTASQDNEALYKLHVMQVKCVYDEVVQNDEAYQNKLVIRKSVHRKKVTFEPGDKVAVALDFGNNQKMRKCKLEQTCNITRKVVSVCSNNRAVRVDVDSEIKNFAAKNLKKLRE
ncbi:1388_t:CDS:2, partial [Racocetra persica]